MLGGGGGRSIVEMAPICVGVATTKCNALREVGEMNLVGRQRVSQSRSFHAVGRGWLLSFRNWIHRTTQPPVSSRNSKSRQIVQGALQGALQ
jgi:hypothetical protein